MRDLAAIVVMQLAAMALGGALLRGVRAVSITGAFPIATRLVVGNGLLALVTLVFGLAGVLSTTAFWLTDAALAGWTVVEFLRSPRSLRGPASVGRWDSSQVVLAVLLGGYGLITLVQAVAPPVAKDVVAYQLAVVRWYEMEGRIAFVPNNWPFHFPQVANWSFLHASVLSGPGAAKLVDVLSWAGCLFGVAGLCPSISGARLLAAVLFASIEVVSGHAGMGFVDLWTGMYGLLALGVAMAALESGQSRSSSSGFLCAGFLAGFAAGTKLTGILVPFSLLVLLVHSRAGLRAVILLAFGTACTGLPAYLVNWVQAGNPVYPFFHGAFGGRELTPEFSALIFGLRDASRVSAIENAFRILRLPWDLTACWKAAGETNVLGPGLLAFLPLAPWSPADRVRTIRTAVFCLAYLGAWFWISPMIRLAHPAWGALCALAAVIAVTVPFPSLRWKAALIGPVIGCCALALAGALRWNVLNGTIPWLLGRADEATLVSSRLSETFRGCGVEYRDLLKVMVEVRRGDPVLTTIPFKFYIEARHEDLSQLLARDGPRPGAGQQVWKAFAKRFLEDSDARGIGLLLLGPDFDAATDRLIRTLEEGGHLEVVSRTRTVVLFRIKSN